MRNNPFDKQEKTERIPVVNRANQANKETTVEPEPAAELGEVDDNQELAPIQDFNIVGPNNKVASDEKTYPKKEILPMMDDLLMHGYATSAFSMRKTKVVVRTRFTWEEQAIYKHMETVDLKTAIAYQREFSTVYIAASLAQFGDFVFEPINAGKPEELKAALDDRIEFVSSLNTVFTDIIQKKLYDFDDKQRFLIANFDALMQDF